MKFDSIQAGATYWTLHKGRAGNTTMKTTLLYPVRVISTDTVNQTVVASWNGNPKQIFRESQYKSWRKNKPLMIAGPSGFTTRLATREEIAAHKASMAQQEGK